MKNASRRMIIMCMLIVFATNVFSIKANAAFDVNAYLCQYAEKNYKATIAQMYEAEYKKKPASISTEAYSYGKDHYLVTFFVQIKKNNYIDYVYYNLILHVSGATSKDAIKIKEITYGKTVLDFSVPGVSIIRDSEGKIVRFDEDGIKLYTILSAQEYMNSKNFEWLCGNVYSYTNEKNNLVLMQKDKTKDIRYEYENQKYHVSGDVCIGKEVNGTWSRIQWTSEGFDRKEFKNEKDALLNRFEKIQSVAYLITKDAEYVLANDGAKNTLYVLKKEGFRAVSSIDVENSTKDCKVEYQLVEVTGEIYMIKYKSKGHQVNNQVYNVNGKLQCVSGLSAFDTISLDEDTHRLYLIQSYLILECVSKDNQLVVKKRNLEYEDEKHIDRELFLPLDGETVKDPKTGYKYQVLGIGKLDGKVLKGATVAFKAAKKKSKKVTIPAAITINHVTYKVVSVSDNAFKNNKNVTKVTIGKNVKSIGQNAFRGCKKLNHIIIKSKSLKKVGKNAISGIRKKTVISIPKGKAKKYKKLFEKNTGFKKTMKVK